MNYEAAGAVGRSMLDEICREGARTMLPAALEVEVDGYLAELGGERDEDGRTLVTHNGHARPALVRAGATFRKGVQIENEPQAGRSPRRTTSPASSRGHLS
ncbi:MAG: hypothetical protein ACYCXN_15860 [Acidimicrobiales bacterium]